MLQVIIPEDDIKLDKQIEASEWQIKHDTNPKDKKIHQAVYSRLVDERERRRNSEGKLVCTSDSFTTSG